MEIVKTNETYQISDTKVAIEIIIVTINKIAELFIKSLLKNLHIIG